MSKDTDKLDRLLSKMIFLTEDEVMRGHISLAHDSLTRIIEDMEGMEFNEKHLRRDCERLRRELDDEMGIMR